MKIVIFDSRINSNQKWYILLIMRVSYSTNAFRIYDDHIYDISGMQMFIEM